MFDHKRELLGTRIWLDSKLFYPDYRCCMKPTEEQLTALGNYRDIIIQHVPEIAEAIGVSPQTITGWTEGKGEPTRDQAEKILEFLNRQTKSK